MPTPVTVTIPHKLGKSEARARVASGFDQLKGQLSMLGNFQQQWDQDRLNFSARSMGQTIRGLIEVGDSDVRIEVELPMLLAGMAETVAGQLRQQGRILLEKK